MNDKKMRVIFCDQCQHFLMYGSGNPYHGGWKQYDFGTHKKDLCPRCRKENSLKLEMMVKENICKEVES